MQCWIGIGWSAIGSAQQIKQFRLFCDAFFPFLFSQDAEMDITEFCNASQQRIDEILREQALQTEFILRFAERLKGRMDTRNQKQAIELAQKYGAHLCTWLFSPFGACGGMAAQLLSDWGIAPPYRGLGAVGSFSNAIFGEYVPKLKAVCVRLDVVAQSEHPAIKFLETLLHEEVHAAIHYAMGDDSNRLELTWLNELCAVLTSQHALRVAGQQQLAPPTIQCLEEALCSIRKKQQYGELADVVVEETGDPLIALKAWKRVFELSDPEKRDYAKGRVITPILRDLGWQVNFPFKYGNKCVTVFV
jgi:hypothetical protein